MGPDGSDVDPGGVVLELAPCFPVSPENVEKTGDSVRLGQEPLRRRLSDPGQSPIRQHPASPLTCPFDKPGRAVGRVGRPISHDVH
jgi:hypothetical protein